MSMSDEAKDPSRIRQALRQTEEQRSQHVEALLAERGPLIRGTYRLQGGRCGRPGCRCSRGQLHEKAMLYRREDGVFRCSYVPLEARGRIENLNRNYRASSKARTALAKLGKRTLQLADALQEALIEPYPSAARLDKQRPPQAKRKLGKRS